MSEMIKAKKKIEAPRIVSAETGDGDYVLKVTWETGKVSRVDLTEPIFRLRHLRRLRKMQQFKKVSVADWGWAVAWGEDLDFSGSRLWALANEQTSAEMTPSEFRGWLHRNHLTQQESADLLGVSKRSVAYYSTGAQPVSRVLRLAMKGAELELPRKKKRA